MPRAAARAVCSCPRNGTWPAPPAVQHVVDTAHSAADRWRATVAQSAGAAVEQLRALREAAAAAAVGNPRRGTDTWDDS